MCLSILRHTEAFHVPALYVNQENAQDKSSSVKTVTR